MVPQMGDTSKTQFMLNKDPKDDIFDSLIWSEMFGPAQNMANNGNIYRVSTSTGNTTCLAITFYSSTLQSKYKVQDMHMD